MGKIDYKILMVYKLKKIVLKVLYGKLINYAKKKKIWLKLLVRRELYYMKKMNTKKCIKMRVH
jgi:hypothetical protein